MEELNFLEIQILLHCDKGTFTKSDLSQIFKKYSLVEKQKTVRGLLIKDLLIEKVLPKIGAKVAPTFYILTAEGKKWVAAYKKNYPTQ